MKRLTAEWVQKAEGDFTVASRELRARTDPNYDAASFHVQQCVEKYLKARLQEAGIQFPKTHHLPTLLQLVLAVEPQWTAFLPLLQQLDQYSVDVRYPGLFVSKDDARAAQKICRQIRQEVRRRLRLPAP